MFVSISALNDHYSPRKLPAEVALEYCVLQESTPREMLA